MSTRVVSKRTKALFIGFGAAAIATACVVTYGPGSEKTAAASTVQNRAVAAPATK